MENATKGLLIAAAVLIAIVIIALGIKLLSSTGETTESAKKTGDALNEATGKVSESAIDKMHGLLGEDNGRINVSIYIGKNSSNYVTIQAEKNMTWNEFINGTYNRGKFAIDPYKRVVYNYNGYTCIVRKKSDNTMQTHDMKMLSNAAYYIEVD